MQRHQLGLIWGALVTAGGSVNIHSVLGFLIFGLGLVVSYRSAVGLGMDGVSEQLASLKRQLAAKRPKRDQPAEIEVPEEQVA